MAAAALVCAGGCTRPNPAFDIDEATSPGTGPVAGDADGTDAGPDDAGTSSASTTAVTTTGDTGAVVDDGSADDPTTPMTDSGSSEGGASCSVARQPLFSIEAFDGLGNPVQLQCGVNNAFTGIVANAGGGDSLTLDRCPSGGCSCGVSEVDPLTLQFIDLFPVPSAAVDFAATPCVSISIFTAPDDAGCDVLSASMESAQGVVDFPLYIATNGFEASSLLLPPISLQEPARLCEMHECQADAVPGRYSLFFGDTGPISPGDSATVIMDPYASGGTTYEVHDRFSYIDEACETHVGWTAAWAGG